MAKKRRHPKHLSTRMSAERVKEIIRQNYEPGRQDRCKMWVFRHIIYPQTGISERTYWRYQNEIAAEKKYEDPNQLRLF